jgi:hypothetical protein
MPGEQVSSDKKTGLRAEVRFFSRVFFQQPLLRGKTLVSGWRTALKVVPAGIILQR